MAGRCTAEALGAMIGLIVIVLFLIWLTSPDPKFNPASFEDAPLEPGLAPLSEAVTLAQVMQANGQTHKQWQDSQLTQDDDPS
ncbi:MAG: hypothetical protein DCO98_01480 [Altererythrobacter sp. XM-24bin4]|uniref:Uncharacterized protein n=1 Tax=Altererythrobacter rubellus TaxID=2173831 RepID=A0A9Y2F6C0_9SPHN|nr:hypothetical protein [Altererythrobacter rubellus]PWL25069.1 MAG: hypothetical protein DCO98_01480 [Altererythrobacter sp. XM-24bin4]WIW95697.1 hypothetical protein QQX03_00895 [Altererythrobacter rubellus]